jgi:hypothetical protein
MRRVYGQHLKEPVMIRILQTVRCTLGTEFRFYKLSRYEADVRFKW